MQKIWFTVIWVALLLGQVPLAGAVVICTTDDGRARIERSNHHGHGHSTDHDGTHEHPVCHVDACAGRVVPAACCRDITLNSISPSLVQAKRVGSEVSTVWPLKKVVYSEKQHIGIPAMSYDCLDADRALLRSVILLI